MNTVESLQKSIKMKQAIERLKQNDDFQLVFLNYYLIDFCAEKVKDSINTSKFSEDSIVQAQAAGYFEQFINMIVIQGTSAEKELSEISKEIDPTESIWIEDNNG